ncbi:MAG: DUF2164 domain-containing protein [Negativicutes bacterium]|nr:DUF2164 domain-containing protein [Negativicutes bacterium]
MEINKGVKQELLNNIKHFFLTERNEDISDFQASFLLDFILDHIAPYIYNQAITDAHTMMSGKIEDLYGLEKRPRPTTAKNKEE